MRVDPGSARNICSAAQKMLESLLHPTYTSAAFVQTLFKPDPKRAKRLSSNDVEGRAR